MGVWIRRRLGRGPRLRLSQSLGAFTRPGEEGISPLYVFFEVTNAGPVPVEISRLFVAATGETGPVYGGPFEGEPGLPHALAPGGSARFYVRAKALAGDLKRAGHGGRPRVRLVVEDADGNRREKGFRLRVDDYLRLRDE